LAVNRLSGRNRPDSIRHRKEREEREGKSHSTVKGSRNDLDENCDVPVPAPTDLPHFFALFATLAVNRLSDSNGADLIRHRKEREGRKVKKHSTIKTVGASL